ncbi:MAG TPA: tetratricopeptide repeat protein [Vicinamibacterales bacterium]|nr:tetratricopeptide repeat protein [Vicinamibacterales bacterium]
MKLESLVFAVAGMFLGLIAGWLIGSQQPATPGAAALTPSAQPAPVETAAQTPRAFDQAEAARLEAAAAAQPTSAAPLISLGNLYFDAERYSEAAEWYEKALALDPNNADVSTDLGVSYYYLNQPDRALAQFRRSLAIDPRHTKTMLNEGIVLAFGKQDLEGAARAWERVVAIAPGSPEGQTARRALESMRAAHPTMGAGGAGSGN